MKLREALPESIRELRAVDVLERSLEGDRLGHGILLHGESLPWLETIARTITGELLGSRVEPFGHPDCFILRPEGRARMIRIGTEAERKGGEWPENSMRRLIIDLQKTANQGERKVGIVMEADRMNRSSANAFLKTLEEPPAGTTLFLLTSRPYDLLDTIRSRCLNFRIPGQMESVDPPEWHHWLEDYNAWLRRLQGRPNRQEIPHILLGSYGLNVRFQDLLADFSKAVWEERAASIPETVTDEEKAAMEAGISRGLRTRLLGDIEKATVAHARSLEVETPGTLPVNAVGRAVAALEHAARLLDLNLNQATALEHFFLQSLRIWTGR